MIPSWCGKGRRRHVGSLRRLYHCQNDRVAAITAKMAGVNFVKDSIFRYWHTSGLDDIIERKGLVCNNLQQLLKTILNVSPDPTGLLVMLIVSENNHTFNYAERNSMEWVFVVVRNNSVERVKIFSNYWDGAKNADNFLKTLGIDNFPNYNRGEYYRDNELSVGLYPNI